MAKKMKVENGDVIGNKCVKDDSNLVFGDKEKLCVWKAHYENQLNDEFDWDKSNLSTELPIEGPPIKLEKDMIAEAILKLKEGKACGPSGICIEMIKWGGDELLNIIVDLMNLIIKEDRIPEDWN